MKPVEELGINPTPWKLIPYGSSTDSTEATHGDIVDAINHPILSYNCFPIIENARLIAAAPKMYNELWKICFVDSNTINCRKCKGEELGRCSSCPLGGARSALAEASGEVSNG